MSTITTYCAPKHTPDQHTTPGDYHEQQDAVVSPQRPLLLPQVGHEQPMGPVRAGGMPGRVAAPTTADRTRLDGHEAHPSQQHAIAVTGARPSPALVVQAPTKASCLSVSASEWL